MTKDTHQKPLPDDTLEHDDDFLTAVVSSTECTGLIPALRGEESAKTDSVIGGDPRAKARKQGKKPEPQR